MKKPLISLVCGTYERLPTLQRMIASVRNTLPPTFALEIIIADNASSDGTWEWLESQSAIVKIQMGAPVGAIKAFTEAAYHATGDYVLIATDDIHFPEHAIVTALSHLETTPTCGAVTFMHNKSRESFSADYAPVVIDGTQVMKPYTQISLIRRDLGNKIGWWGGRHSVMGQGFTYAGDNFLSSGIWERGFTVDTVEGAINHEDVIEDAPRALNKAGHKKDAELFFSLYPKGAIVPKVAPKTFDNERLRILFLMHYSPKHPSHRLEKRGIREGFQEYGIVYDYDYAGRFESGFNINNDLWRICEAFKPHVIFSQFHNCSNGIDEDTTHLLRRSAPSAVMLNWNGDVWTKNVDNPKTQAMLAPFDVLTFTSSQLCKLAASKTGVPSFYAPNYFEPIYAVDETQSHWDVLFTGNAYTPERFALMRIIKAMPYKTGIYGQAEGIQTEGETNYQWATTCGLYKNAKIIISDQQFQDAHGYVSNRLWEAMAMGGGLCLQQHAPDLDEMTGLQKGVHYVEWQSMDELPALVDYYLANPAIMREIAQAAQAYTLKNQSCAKRVQDYFEGILWLSQRDSKVAVIFSKMTSTA